MPWYKFYADYGPGHQSHSAEYRWYDKPQSPREKKEEFYRIFGDKEWPVGKCILLKGLPTDIAPQKIQNAQDMIEEGYLLSKKGEKLLSILEKTPLTGMSVEMRRKRKRDLWFKKAIEEARKRTSVKIFEPKKEKS
jgi:hypothetical protein